MSFYRERKYHIGENNRAFRIGHVTHHNALTGCTVILCPSGTIGSCDVRGSSPATRETALLAPDKSIMEIHALLLTGGSAFGLSAADGVMKYLEEHRIGYQTPWVRVPIIPTAAIFDLNIGQIKTHPTAIDGYNACLASVEQNIEQGNSGAGMGATVGKWAGWEYRMKGGIGLSKIEMDEIFVESIAVVNPVGDVVGRDGNILAGAIDQNGEFIGRKYPIRPLRLRWGETLSNTTLIAIITNTKLTKVMLNRVAQRAHDGIARAVVPAHTSYDGDIVFALASQIHETSFDIIAELAAETTAQAIRNAVHYATSAGGVKGLAQ